MAPAAVKGVVLAAGRGTRMRRAGSGARLSPAQRIAAEAGRKALIPFHGHPFLDYVLTELADAGLEEICLVVGPGQDPIRERYEVAATSRLAIRFAVQARPTGSAHALLAAETFAAGEPVVVVNADNLYPAGVVDRVQRTEGHALAGFRAGALTAEGGIAPERVAAFALVRADERGCLRSIVEKPDPAEMAGFGADPLVSMTCWRFMPEAFEACREVDASPRGEHELPDAVLELMRTTGACVRVLPVESGVLDLTGQNDIPTVDARLRGREVRL